MLRSMAPPIPTVEPTAMRAGDTLAFTISESDYPASDGWALAYTLINSAGKITFTSSASGDSHAVSVAAATTAAYTAGVYQWTARATLGAASHTIRSGQIEILPDPAVAAAYDTRTHARRTLDALEAWIEGHDMAVANYRIGDRAMQYIPIGELLPLRDRYRAEVRREDAKATGRLLNRIQVRL